MEWSEGSLSLRLAEGSRLLALASLVPPLPDVRAAARRRKEAVASTNEPPVVAPPQEAARAQA
jgi:hypothetical protein